MEEDIQIIEYKNIDLSNSVLIEAFPTVGLVSSIAGHFLVEQLNLEEIGTISSRYFMPAAVIHNGMPSPPVRIYASKKICGSNGDCDQIVVIISEFMPSVDIIKPVASMILVLGAEKEMQSYCDLRRNPWPESEKTKNIWSCHDTENERHPQEIFH